MPGWLRRLRREEQGSIAATAAMCMVMFVGCLGLAMDSGMLYIQRTQLQKAVDASALAAAYDLMPNSGKNPDTDAATYAGFNQVLSSELVSATTGKITVHDGPCATNGCPAYQVTAQRSVPSSFAGLVGFTGGSPKTTAVAIASVAQAVQSEYLLPYGVWDGNSTHIQLNQTITFRDNGWQSDNVSPDPSACGDTQKNQPPCNPNWNLDDNSFKGFLHMPADKCGSGTSTQYSVGNTFDSSKGGNSDENACKTILNAAAAAGTAVIMPVIDYGCKNSGCDGGPASNCSSGDICVHIKGFVGVIPNSVGSMGQAWTGKLVNWTTYQATPGGSATSEPALYVLKLWY
ncbi:MAG TPA: pilus assembly protein TadG-related protein [Chloroflexota bacterium]|nr:pilus assembly protein TadG-related protein [Chloroflexota bacterium]